MQENTRQSFLVRPLSAKETLLSFGVLAPALLYIILLLYAWFFSDGLLFRPPPPSYRGSPDIIKLSTHDGISISARYLPNPQAHFTVLYSHGNSEDLGDSEEALMVLRKMGLAVFAYDYEGYGTSQGTPSERRAYQDIDAAYDHLTGTLGVPPDRIIAYGFSMGSGPAVDLASRKPLAGLIVESAFASAFRVALPARILPFDKFHNLEKIAGVSCPVLILHGTADSVIPVQHAELLYHAAHEPKRMILFDGLDHFGIKWDRKKRYAPALEEFLAKLNQSRQ